MKTKAEILENIFNPSPEDCTTLRQDLQVAITLSPSLDLIEQAMQEYAEAYHQEQSAQVVPTKQMACFEVDRGISIYNEPEDMQSKMLSREEYVKTAYVNGFLNCYDWINRQLKTVDLREENEEVYKHYHLNCDSCGMPYWSEEASPQPRQMCPKCKQDEPETDNEFSPENLRK